jgi:hypothetical protein
VSVKFANPFQLTLVYRIVDVDAVVWVLEHLFVFKFERLDGLIGSQKASVLNGDLQLVSGEHAIREKTPLRRGGAEG